MKSQMDKKSKNESCSEHEKDCCDTSNNCKESKCCRKCDTVVKTLLCFFRVVLFGVVVGVSSGLTVSCYTCKQSKKNMHPYNECIVAASKIAKDYKLEVTFESLKEVCSEGNSVKSSNLKGSKKHYYENQRSESSSYTNKVKK